MNDELGRQLQALHEQAPEGEPNLTRVLHAGKRRRLQLTIAVAGLVTVVALAGVVAVPRLAGEDRTGDVAGHDDGVFVPAEKRAPTYELFDLEVLYPWAPDGGPNSSAEAGLSYRWRWATKKYPGEVQCEATLLSADGSVVGRATWGLTGLETKSRRAHVVGVHVTDPPVEARAGCEAGAYARGPGVDVDFVRAGTWTPTYIEGATPPPDQIVLVFEATALAEDHVDSRMCFMTVWFESGRKETVQFTTNRGEGTWRYKTGYRTSDPVADAKMRCRAIRASDSRPRS